MSSSESTTQIPPAAVAGTSGVALTPPAKTTPASALEGPKNYRIVKVQMPDGTIQKIKRTIPQAPTGEPSSKPAVANATTTIPATITTTPAPAKINGKPKEAADAHEPNSANEKVKAQTPSKVASHSSPVTPSEIPSAHSTKKEEQAPSKTEATHDTLQKNASFAARFFRNFRTLHRGVSQVAAGLDPDYDVVDGADGGDETEDESDNDDDDNSGEHDADNDNASHHSGGEADDDRNAIDQSTANSSGEPTSQTGRDHTVTSSQETSTLVHGIYGVPMTPAPKPTTASKISPTSKPSPLTNHVPSQKRDTVKSAVEIEEKAMDESDHKIHETPSKKKRFLNNLSFGLSRIIIIIITVLLPLFYVVLGILTAKISGTPSDSSLGKGVHQAITIAITAWPIMFAALVAQSLKALATYRVERGIRLMTLEQLINSHSVASAIKQPFFLQRFDWITIALLCLWSLSPLASQALQRMSSVDINGSTSTATVYYLSTLQKPLGFGDFKSATDILYGASILTPEKSAVQPMDDWNSPKIPILENLKTQDGAGWYVVDPFKPDPKMPNQLPPYASLIGISLSGPTDGVNMTFSFESSYFVLVCPAFQSANSAYQILGNSTLSASGGGTLRMGITPIGNTTSTTDTQQGSWTIALQQADQTYGYTTCKFSQSFVESHVICAGTNCAVDKMRRSTVNSANPLALADLKDFVSAFTTSDSSNSSAIRTRTEEYIYGGPQAAGANSGFDDHTYDIFSMDQALVNQALSILFNTYWQAGIVPWQETSLDISGLQSGTNPEKIITNENAGVVNTSLVYVTSVGWLVVLFICSLVLLAAGVSSIVLSSLTVSPDFLGFASTVLRKTKYVNMPKLDGERTMGASGAERARLMADVRVMVQDTKPEAPVGKIVLGPAGEKANPLKKGRPYQ